MNKPDKRREYDEALKAKALCLARASRLIQAAYPQNCPKRICWWQRQAHATLPGPTGAQLAENGVEQLAFAVQRWPT